MNSYIIPYILIYFDERVASSWRHTQTSHLKKFMKNLTRKQTMELVDIIVDINLTKDCEDIYVSNGGYLENFCKKYSDVDEKVLDRFINFKTRAGMRAMGDDPDSWKEMTVEYKFGE